MLDAFQSFDRDVFSRVGHSYTSGFCRVLELMVVTVAGNFVPAIRKQYLDDFSGGITFHIITLYPSDA